jgi:2-oxo-4-hydroxy-4-carboxy-5-ureidoimidazoline decarboxylase
MNEVNAMDAPAFVARFGGIAEHSPWVAERAATLRPFASREAMVEAFTKAVMEADEAHKLDLIRKHPDLAGKAKLTEHSKNEQAGAGLGSLTPDEFARFTRMNDEYKARFGFPFIFAVKGATKHQILEAFEARLPNSKEAEFATALAQVCRILRFRIEAEVSA